MSKHSVQDSKKLTHTGSKSHLFFFTCGTEALIKGSDDGIMPAGYQGAHIEHGSYLSSSSPNAAFAPEVAAVSVKGSDTYQSSYLPAVQSSQFREFCQKSSRDDRAYTGNAPQEIVFLSPDRAFTDFTPQGMINISHLLFQPSDMGLDALAHNASGSEEAIPLCHNHLHNLTSTSHDVGEFPGLSIRYRSRFGLDIGSEMSHHLGIQNISLGQLSHSSGEIPDLAGIDHRYRQPSHYQGSSKGHLDVSGSFQNHQSRGHSLEARDSLANTSVIVGEAPALLGGMHSHVQTGLGYIDTCIQFRFLHYFFLLYGPSLHDTGSFGPGNCSGSLEIRARRLSLFHGLCRPSRVLK
jgi:hypothetical protein